MASYTATGANSPAAVNGDYSLVGTYGGYNLYKNDAADYWLLAQDFGAGNFWWFICANPYFDGNPYFNRQSTLIKGEYPAYSGSGTVTIADWFGEGVVTSPTITGLSVSSGPTNGGTTVVITGTDFSATYANAVKFGATDCSYTVDSITQITATSPAHIAGTVDVSVTNIFGTSPNTSADDFTYIATKRPLPTFFR